MSANPWRFRFAGLEDDEEGERVSLITGKKKRDYVGQVCRQVSTVAPYGMQFVDGAVWALDVSQLELVDEDDISYRQFGPSTDRYRKPVRCIETGEIFTSLGAAAKWAGVRASAIGSSCSTCRAVGGYHFEHVERDER